MQELHEENQVIKGHERRLDPGSLDVTLVFECQFLYVIYKFNRIPINMPWDLFLIRQTDSKIYIKNKSQKISEKKSHSDRQRNKTHTGTAEHTWRCLVVREGLCDNGLETSRRGGGWIQNSIRINSKWIKELDVKKWSLTRTRKKDRTLYNLGVGKVDW